MSEAVNGVLKGARRLPIVPLVEITLNRSAQYFLQRTARANRMVMDNQQWADYAFRLFEARQAEAIHHIVQKFDYNQQSALGDNIKHHWPGSRTYVVKLRQQMCSCGKWATHGIPCSHAIQASRHFGMNASNFINILVQEHTRRHIWGDLSQCMGRSIGIPFILSLCIIRPSELAEDRDEMSQTRIRNEMDQPQRRARQQYQAHQT
ncbi:UNVERIFIED_CONTAM: hypothetical protein Sradi_2801200 [Sesamum radiatum]|uniref:SWIM-type domain-containing protein n=1 Tax=Sesamum radiatum TaxID=300843 RepID=A0AAW2RVG0_SESRA